MGKQLIGLLLLTLCLCEVFLAQQIPTQCTPGIINNNCNSASSRRSSAAVCNKPFKPVYKEGNCGLVNRTLVETMNGLCCYSQPYSFGCRGYCYGHQTFSPDLVYDPSESCECCKIEYAVCLILEFNCEGVCSYTRNVLAATSCKCMEWLKAGNVMRKSGHRLMTGKGHRYREHYQDGGQTWPVDLFY